jgi:hypothetical protein
MSDTASRLWLAFFRFGVHTLRVPLQFNEVMQGWMRLASDGSQHPFSFDLQVRGSWREHWDSGNVPATGLTYAAPLAKRAVTTATIGLRPFGDKVIDYNVWFATDQGEPAQFIGNKTINWLAAKSSWTTLPGQITIGHGADAKLYATCELRFDIRRDWWSFAKSFVTG